MENISETFIPFKIGQTLFILMEECLPLREVLFNRIIYNDCKVFKIDCLILDND